MKLQDIIKLNIIFDSHCHLNTVNFDNDRQEVINRTVENGVANIIDIGTDLVSSKKSVTLSKQYKDIVYSSVGIHPEMYVPGSDLFSKNYNFENDFVELEKLLSENPEEIVIIGETGLDYYWLDKLSHQSSVSSTQLSTNSQLITHYSKQDIHNSVNRQLELFDEHIKLAVKHNLPLSIHSRDAVDDCIKLVKKYNCTGIFHSLTNESSTSLKLTINDQEKKFYRQMNEILEMGFSIGINGIITYKSAEIMRDMFKKVINEKTRFKPKALNQLKDKKEFLHLLYKTGFLLETDSPFLIPSNYKTIQNGRNDPGAIKGLLEYLWTLF
jgi:TatD DNase family protein